MDALARDSPAPLVWRSLQAPWRQHAHITPPYPASARPASTECCIFHKQRAFGEWSDDDDSDKERGECGEPGGGKPDQQPTPQPPPAPQP